MASILNSRAFLVGILAVLGLTLLFVLRVFAPPEKPVTGNLSVKINNALFSVEVVDDAAGRARGLSGKKSIPEFGGMLFRFGREGIYAFWMKDMNFPIDIFWIQDGRVVYLVKNAMPLFPGARDSDLEVFTSTSPADEVLELNAGMAERFNIKEGDVVEMSP